MTPDELLHYRRVLPGIPERNEPAPRRIRMNWTVFHSPAALGVLIPGAIWILWFLFLNDDDDDADNSDDNILI